jgi:hypothetical protein
MGTGGDRGGDGGAIPGHTRTRCHLEQPPPPDPHQLHILSRRRHRVRPVKARPTLVSVGSHLTPTHVDLGPGRRLRLGCGAIASCHGVAVSAVAQGKAWKLLRKDRRRTTHHVDAAQDGGMEVDP